ncbi:MAG: type II toxin-antitoxin system VapC family toxin [Candidatus Eremiobacterota bacterium]
MSFVIDTGILIDHLPGRPETGAWMSENGDQGLAVSVITRAELLAGMRPDEVDATTRLLGALVTIPVDNRVADVAGEYRRQYFKSHGLLLPDALIAATARTQRMTLVTLKVRDFPMTDLQILRPY